MQDDREANATSCMHMCTRARCVKRSKPDARQLTLGDWLYVKVHDELCARLTIIDDPLEKEELNRQYSQKLDVIRFAW